MSLILVDGLKDRPGTGGPKFPNGLHLPAGIGITGDGHINMAGVSSFSELSVSGNVTIGGTLTYEDVTNIDVVGVSTFAGRMNVNSTIQANEGLNVTAGIVTVNDYIQHAGDTNTNIRFPAADTITAETGGSERIRVTSTGVVGVGTAAPVSRVFEAFTPNTSTPSLTWQGGNPGQRFVNEGSELKFGLTAYAPYAYFIQANTSGSGHRQLTLNPMGGSVAIGVTDPPTASGLVARYDSTFVPTLTWNSAGGHILRDEGSELNFGLSSITPHPFFIQGRTSGNAARQIAINPLGGNVAINTSIANNTLNLGDNAGVGVRFHNYTTNNSYYLTVESGDNVSNNVGGSGYYTWITGGSEKVRLTNAGRVGINTDTPLSLLTVAAPSASAEIELKRTNSNTTGAIGAINWTAMDGHSVASIWARGDGNNEGAHLVFKTTSAAAEQDPYGTGTIERLRITSTGDVGIGTNNPTRGPLHVHQNSTGDCAIHLTNQETGVTSSDGFTIFTGGDAGPDAGFVNREDGGAIEIYTHNGSSVGERVRIGPAGQIGCSGANYGTSGQVLTSQGNSSNVVWADAGGGAWEVVSTTVLSGSTSDLQLYGWSNSYAQYKVVFNDCYHVNSTVMRIRFYLDGTSGQNGTLNTSNQYKTTNQRNEYGSNMSSTFGGGAQFGAGDDYMFPAHINSSPTAQTMWSGELIFPMKTTSYNQANKCYGHILGQSYLYSPIGCQLNDGESDFLTGIHIYWVDDSGSPGARSPSTGRVTLLRMKYS